jgi:WD40 repeat protein
LWDRTTGTEVRRFKHQQVQAVAFSRDGKQIATGGWDRAARIWDAESGVELRRLDVGVFVNSVAFSRDGTRVLVDGSLWDAKSGNYIRYFGGHCSVFSPDGTQVLTGGDDKVARLWDAATGKEVRSFDGHTGGVKAVAFSPDGKQVLTVSLDKSARLWETATGRVVKVFSETSTSAAAAFSPDGRQVLILGADDTMHLWDLESAQVVRRIGGRSTWVTAVAYSRDGRRAALGTWFGTVVLWDLAAGKEVRRLAGHATPVDVVAFSPTGAQLLTGTRDATAVLWDTAAGKELRRFKGQPSKLNLMFVTAQPVAYSPDGKYIVTRSSDFEAILWDAASGGEVRRIDGKAGMHLPISCVAFSADGTEVLARSQLGVVVRWDVATGNEVGRFTAHNINYTPVAYSPDGQFILTGSDNKSVRVWDRRSNKDVGGLEGHADAVTAIALSPDGKQVLTGSQDRTARLWDLAARTGVRRFEGHAAPVLATAFSPDGRHVLTGGQDNTARLWDAATGQELCRLVSFRDRGWAVVDRAGRFDAPNGGDVDGLHWVVGNEPIALSQLKVRYYEPDLLAKLLGFNPAPVRDVRALEGVQLHPAVTVAPPAPGTTAATVRLTNRGGGIGPVLVRVNGKELLADARGPSLDPEAREATLRIDLATARNLVPAQPNRVEVVAYNADGYLRSRDAEAVYIGPAAPPAAPPQLHAIVCGVSAYAKPELALRYAAKDAEDFATAVEVAGKALFGPDRVHVTVLTTTGRAGTAQPTKANIAAAFAAASKAAPGDVLVVYLSGHGTTLGQGADLYVFPTRDATSLAAGAFADTAVRAATAVTSDELAKWVKAVPANKQVLVLDTCAAGAAAGRLTEPRAVSGEQVRALDRLKDRTGLHVLMGSAADRVSYEAGRYAQGLLTYSLLEGMRGAALRNVEYVDVARLFGYAADRVPALAGDVGGVQRPLVAAPRGGSFDVGRLTDADKARVPLAPARPLVLLSSFQEEAEFVDGQGLSRLVDQRLRDLSAAGPAGTVVLVEATEFPGAYRVGGRYALSGDKVTVRVKLYLDANRIAEFARTGSKGSLPELASQVAAEVGRQLSRQK